MKKIDAVLSAESNVLRIVRAEDSSCKECKKAAVEHHTDLVMALTLVSVLINNPECLSSLANSCPGVVQTIDYFKQEVVKE